MATKDEFTVVGYGHVTTDRQTGEARGPWQMDHVGNLRAVIVGATGGVGSAVARELTGDNVSLTLVARSAEPLVELAAELRNSGAEVQVVATDLRDDEELEAAASEIRTSSGGLDLLVHAAGVFARERIEDGSLETLDELFRVNFRARFLLTRELLPLLEERGGMVAFVNSTAAFRAGAELSVYAASMRANRALADSLRDEVNPAGVRVLTIYLGRTATGMQEKVHALEGRRYEPERFIQPSTVAQTLVFALSMPRDAEMTEMTLRPMQKPRSRS